MCDYGITLCAQPTSSGTEVPRADDRCRTCTEPISGSASGYHERVKPRHRSHPLPVLCAQPQAELSVKNSMDNTRLQSRLLLLDSQTSRPRPIDISNDKMYTGDGGEIR